MLNVTLYKYIGKSNVVNKGGALRVVHDAQADLYNEVGPIAAATFVLDKLYQANYCRYEYNGFKCAAYLTITTMANGLYQYACRPDPLYTCYLNGCFNVEDEVIYATYSDQPSSVRSINLRRSDPRSVYNTGVSRFHQEFASQDADGTGQGVFEWLYVVNIITPWTNQSEHTVYGRKEGYTTYLMNDFFYDQFMKALYKFNDDDFAKYSGSIYNVYRTPYLDRGHNMTSSIVPTEKLLLFSVRNSTIGHSGNVDWTEINFAAGGTIVDGVWMIKQNAKPLSPYIIRYKLDKSTGWDSDTGTAMNITDWWSDDLNRSMLQSTVTCHLANMADFNFVPTNIGVHKRITSFGARVSTNVLTGESRTMLMINSEVIPSMYIDSPAHWPQPLLIDSYNSNPVGTLTNSALSIIGCAISGGQAVAGIAAFDAAGKMTSNFVSDFYGGTNLFGTPGATIDQWSNFGSFIVINAHKEIDTTHLRQKYGYPLGQSVQLNSMNGYYVLDEKATLPACGLPIEIVEEATSIAKGGVYGTA